MHKSSTDNVVNDLLMVSMIFFKTYCHKSMATDQYFKEKCLITAIYFPAIHLNCALPWNFFNYSYVSWLETKPEKWQLNNYKTVLNCVYFFMRSLQIVLPSQNFLLSSLILYHVFEMQWQEENVKQNFQVNQIVISCSKKDYFIQTYVNINIFLFKCTHLLN